MEYLKGQHNTIRATEEDLKKYTKEFQDMLTARFGGEARTPMESAILTLKVRGLVSSIKPANVYYLKRLYDSSKISDILAAAECYTGKPHKACQCYVNGYSSWKGDYYVIRLDEKNKGAKS
jgi:hypothetical protein|tara:strand:- start:768 stop:1130 length:363 start_codon:yes stop_codon:yes gene_type:complete